VPRFGLRRLAVGPLRTEADRQPPRSPLPQRAVRAMLSRNGTEFTAAAVWRMLSRIGCP